MSTQEESSAYSEGVLDVSVIVPVCFQNPLKESAVRFISEVLTQKRRIALPTPAVLGAYHVATRYLGTPKVAVKKVLEGILKSGSPALYPHVPAKTALDGLDYAVAYNVESWDGYLISLTRTLGSTVIYTLDLELSKVKEILAVNPFSKEKVKQYHRFIEAKKDRC